MSKPDVELRVPAQSPYVAVLRMTTAGLAARLDFTLDDIEDLRIAVGEACALLLENGDGQGDIVATFALGTQRMRLRVALETQTGTTASVDRDSFGWQVISALVDDLGEESGAGSCAITFAAMSAKA